MIVLTANQALHELALYKSHKLLPFPLFHEYPDDELDEWGAEILLP